MNQHIRRQILLAVLVAMLFRPTAVSANPKSLTSEYLETFSGGFIYDFYAHDWTMFLFVKPLKMAPDGGPLYFLTEFENPQHGSPALFADGSTLAMKGSTVKLASPPVKGMRDHKLYQVTVRIYADKKHTKLLGSHSQGTQFHEAGSLEAR